MALQDTTALLVGGVGERWLDVYANKGQVPDVARETPQLEAVLLKAHRARVN